MESSYTRKRHSKLRNFMPNRTRVVRNANKTLKRGNASRYLKPKFRWSNTYNVPLTTTSSNGNGNQELTENERANFEEYNANLRNSRRSVPRAKLQIGSPRLSPNLARKMARIMEQHNEPINMKRAVSVNTNLNARGRKILSQYVNYLYQENTVDPAPFPKTIFTNGLNPKLTALLEGLFIRHSNPINMVDEIGADIFLTPDEREVLYTKILENFPDE